MRPVVCGVFVVLGLAAGVACSRKPLGMADGEPGTGGATTIAGGGGHAGAGSGGGGNAGGGSGESGGGSGGAGAGGGAGASGGSPGCLSLTVSDPVRYSGTGILAIGSMGTGYMALWAENRTDRGLGLLEGRGFDLRALAVDRTGANARRWTPYSKVPVDTPAGYTIVGLTNVVAAAGRDGDTGVIWCESARGSVTGNGGFARIPNDATAPAIVASESFGACSITEPAKLAFDGTVGFGAAWRCPAGLICFVALNEAGGLVAPLLRFPGSNLVIDLNLLRSGDRYGIIYNESNQILAASRFIPVSVAGSALADPVTFSDMNNYVGTLVAAGATNGFVASWARRPMSGSATLEPVWVPLDRDGTLGQMQTLPARYVAIAHDTRDRYGVLIARETPVRFAFALVDENGAQVLPELSLPTDSSYASPALFWHGDGFGLFTRESNGTAIDLVYRHIDCAP